jgi:hypothetical protein
MAKIVRLMDISDCRIYFSPTASISQDVKNLQAVHTYNGNQVNHLHDAVTLTNTSSAINLRIAQLSSTDSMMMPVTR